MEQKLLSIEKCIAIFFTFLHTIKYDNFVLLMKVAQN